jgi:hypothetical protein
MTKEKLNTYSYVGALYNEGGMKWKLLQKKQ